jgi:glycosyltransferase involved in cell wall biosynthesis
MLEAGLLYCALAGLMAGIALLLQPQPTAFRGRPRLAAASFHMLPAGALTLVAPAVFPWWLFAAFFAVLGVMTRSIHAGLWPLAQVFLQVSIIALMGWALWLGRAVFGVDLPGNGDFVLRGLFVASLLLLPVGCARLVLHAHMLGRHPRARQPECAAEVTSGPKVSIHVPCCDEPPELVISTLDRLAAIRYADYEVLVIDNNTRDPALWRPVEAHCRMLGERFRFFHVEGIAGAKAGALNTVHRYTADDAELIAVVDADYHLEPDFPGRLVPLFTDPGLGFVQCPHDYRDHGETAFKAVCYAEYMPFQKIELPVRGEWCGGFTVGTLSLIRREALERAGMWAPWCLTEDSELAIRIHALGYGSYNLDRTFGRGLIPEDFARYRRQRFRWTAGPVQQLRRYWRLLMPLRGPAHGGLDRRQRLLELHHGLEPVQAALIALLAPLWVFAWGWTRPPGPEAELAGTIPAALALSAMAVLVSQRALVRRLGWGWRQVLGGVLAHAALRHVSELAGVRALLGRRALRWRRTDKRRLPRCWRKALRDTRQEVGRALIWCALGGWVLHSAPVQPGAATALLVIVTVVMALVYLSAPAVALVAELGHRSRGRAGERVAMALSDSDAHSR